MYNLVLTDNPLMYSLLIIQGILSYTLTHMRMQRTRRSSSALELQRRQIDARFRNAPSLESPRGGWIRTIRQSLGMTMAQMAKRLGIAPPAVAALEKREAEGNVTIATLERAAEALDCEVKVVFVPKTSLEETVRRQAVARARTERNALIHTMRLEDQAEGVESVLDEGKATARWLNENLGRLWD